MHFSRKAQSAIAVAETMLESPDGAISISALRGALQNLLEVARITTPFQDLCRTDEKGYLVQATTVNIQDIGRMIDPQALGVDEKYILEQLALERERERIDEKYRPKRQHPKTQDDLDREFIVELCKPYNPPPDDRDVFVFYDNSGGLSGGSGYIRIRDGYLYGARGYSIS